MRAEQELTSGKDSCMGSALADEMVFVLLGRDEAASYAIRAWCVERMRIGKNQPGDRQITEALDVAATMDRERGMIRTRLGKA